MKLRVKYRKNTYPSYPETFGELELEPSKTALLVIDMQNDFVHPRGNFAARGVDISGANKLIPLVKRVIDACRQAPVKIIYTQHTFRPDFSDQGKMYNEILYRRHGVIAEPGSGAEGQKVVRLVRGSWNTAIVDELAPLPGDIIIDAKHIFDCFYQTDLELVLRNLGIENLIFAGVTCSICVETTLRSAFHRDFRCLLVEDCTWEKQADLESATKKVISMNFGYLVAADDLIEALSKKRQWHKQ
jgi:ureidoacrylate peracid hydrolase